MKKFYIITITFFILIGGFLTSINFIVDKKDYIFFSIRYNFNTTNKIIFPEKLERKDYDQYFIKFKEHGSDLKYFETFYLNQKAEVILDIKTKYISKTIWGSLEIKDLAIFNISNQLARKIISLQFQDLTRKEIEVELKKLAYEFNENLLFEKGLKKLIDYQ